MKVIDGIPEACRENMIFPRAATGACISYLQIVICWQGLCHDTLLTYLLHLLQDSRAAVFFCWPQICCSQHIVSFCFTLININTLLDVLYKRSHFPLWCRNKISPQTVYIPRLIDSSRPSFPLRRWLLCFVFLLRCCPDACLWDRTWGNEM